MSRVPAPRGPRSNSALRLSFTAETGGQYVRYVRTFLRRAFGLESPDALRELSVALVGDKRMAALHEQFMGIGGPTDVLTFELEHDARGRAVAGEVVVCVPYAVRQARRSGLDVKKE